MKCWHGGAASDFLRARETRGTSAGVFLGRCETGGTFVGGKWLFFRVKLRDGGVVGFKRGVNGGVGGVAGFTRVQ